MVFILADDLLKVNPSDPAALSVEMFRQQLLGNSLRAKAIGERILGDPTADRLFREKALALAAQR